MSKVKIIKIIIQLWPAETQSSSGYTQKKRVLCENITTMSNQRRQSQGQQFVSGHSVTAILEDWRWPWSVQTLSLNPFRLEDKIMALQWACCAEKQGPEPRFLEQTASHSCSPSPPIHLSTSTWQKESERHRPTERERKALGSESRPCCVRLNSCV